MPEWLPTVLATIAGILSTSSFVPQVVKAWRERDTRAISKHMYMVTVTAFVLWSAYGFMIGSWPMMVFNLLSLILSAIILAFKIRNDRGKSPGARSPREPGMARTG
ncbi:SemiSWEET transporter [Microvirga terrae]|uniref:SemiSWEET transporter n=1 Tax=Microvirga terrae TaxID=2740529 RepID=A0ABY5RT48_9HYPH|nr:MULTISPECIES: SemiSWEET transporter [Microvirga]MBQ0824890.1 SemiSWEET family sugar transporter [Microvirga sp. HBU67558]UVF20183.1 SemiSWEET transporter [Microvirga terrae]